MIVTGMRPRSVGGSGRGEGQFFSILHFLFLQIVKLLDSLDATLGLSKSNVDC